MWHHEYKLIESSHIGDRERDQLQNAYACSGYYVILFKLSMFNTFFFIASVFADVSALFLKSCFILPRASSPSSEQYSYVSYSI